MSNKDILLKIILEPRFNRTEEMEAALMSSLLPESLRITLLDQIISRLIDRVQGTTGFSCWEEWAKKWKSGEDKSASSAIKAQRWIAGFCPVAEAATRAAENAANGNYKRAASYAATWAMGLMLRRDEKEAARKAEREQQKRDLLAIIEEM